MDLKKIDPNILMIGAGVLAFMGVRYWLGKEEEKSNFTYKKLPNTLVPNRGGFGKRLANSVVEGQGKYAWCTATGNSIEIAKSSADAIESFTRKCRAEGGVLNFTDYLPQGAELMSNATGCGCGG